MKGPLGGNFLLFRELDFQKLKEKIQKVTGIKLNGYRDDFLQRRLIYHFTKNKINGIDEYIDELSFNQILIKDLMDCLSINLSILCFSINSSLESLLVVFNISV